jgi:Mrp family chromosome partitioning ATPase
MQRMFDGLREHFSFIVLDCPPVSRGIETLSLARHCDGTILVVQADRTPARSVDKARDSIDRMGGQVVGTVFNQFREPLGQN